MTLGLGIVGCGTVSIRYAEALRGLGDARLIGATDLRRDRAEERAQSFSGSVYSNVGDLLDDDRIHVVVNLTPPSQHATITRQALEAGRHVYSEKPLAFDVNEARALVDLATRQGRCLASAPASVLGPSQQELVELLRSGRLGRVRAAYGEADWGPNDLTHPHPEGLLEVGPVADVGIYPLALLIAALGRVTSVRASGATLLPDRHLHDHIVAFLAHQSDAVSRLTSSFYVQHRPTSSSVIFHGDEGTALLDSWHGDHAAIHVGMRGAPLVSEPWQPAPTPPVDWGLGIAELLSAVRDGRAPRIVGGVEAAHHVEVLQAIADSIRTDREIRLGDKP